MRLLLGWLLALLALAGAPAHAAYPPRPDGPILDQAGIIPDAEEAALGEKLKAYNAKSGRSLVVATVSSLEGEDIQSYGVGLGQTWGVGGNESDQGLILLVAPNERKMRLEVGYGLEGYMPDVLASRIIRETITPRFKAGDYPGGINAGIDAIIQQLDRDPADARAVAEAAAAAASQRSSNDGAGIGGVVFWIVLILFFMLIFGRGGRRGMRRSGIDPGIVLWGISEVLHHTARGGGGGGGWSSGDGGGFGGFGGGDFGGGGASGDW